MSDSFQMLVDVDATPKEADAVARTVLNRFRKLGLITGRTNRDCVLGGTGYRAGPAVADSYKLGKREFPFWELLTCGVEPKVGRTFNDSVLDSCDGFTCPACGVDIEPLGDVFGEAVVKAAVEWMDESGLALVRCPVCRKKRSITGWQCKPPFGFGNASFRFWNWPPLDSSSWRIDITEIVREATGHTIVKTYGRI